MCSLYIYSMFTVYSLYTQYRLTKCSPYGHCMSIGSRTLFNIQEGGSGLDGALLKISASRFLTIWFLYLGFYYIHYLFTMYSLYVYWMFTAYSLYTDHYRLTTCLPYVHVWVLLYSLIYELVQILFSWLEHCFIMPKAV